MNASGRVGIHRRRTLRAVLAGLLLSPVAACARVDAGADAELVADTASESSEVVLRVEQSGGFLPPAARFGQLPTVTVYADGRVLTQGPQTLVFPGPALPNVELRRIAVEDVDVLVARARAAGVGAGVDLGHPAVADVPTTRFTVTVATGTETLEVYGLNESDPQQADGLTEAQRAGRAKLRELLAALTDLTGTLGPDRVGAAEPYEPEAVAALASPWHDDPEGPTAPPTLAWPGPALPGPSVRSGVEQGCVVVRGAAAAELLALAATANAQTPWTWDDDRWSVALRPLLPDETECADLATD